MITILMAAYNGEKYIAEQIESILNQTETDWRLFIQDDCSSDCTANIARTYARKYPYKIHFLERKTRSESAKNNFISMIPLADSEYCMTCDDDDVWLPNKIELTLQKLQHLENVYGERTPLLVHTDLKVVNEQLNVLSDSMFKRQNMDRKRDKINHLLVQNIVTGCTMMVNRSLLDIAGNIPSQAIMHDWWMALVASAFGHIGFVSEPTILYRQHSQNEVGSKNAKSLHYNLKRLLNKRKSMESLKNCYKQAEVFVNVYGQQLDPIILLTVKVFMSMPQMGKINRIKLLHQYDFWKTGLYRKCGQILFI